MPNKKYLILKSLNPCGTFCFPVLIIAIDMSVSIYQLSIFFISRKASRFLSLSIFQSKMYSLRLNSLSIFQSKMYSLRLNVQSELPGGN